MTKFKTIQLHPTHFECDVWVTEISPKLVQLFKKRYGLRKKDIIITNENECSIVYSSDKSDLKGEIRILLILSELEAGLIIHESYHILKHLCKLTGVTTDYHSQEWSAYFLEYIYKEIVKNNYEIIE
jgi:hypothetical protein